MGVACLLFRRGAELPSMVTGDLGQGSRRRGVWRRHDQARLRLIWRRNEGSYSVIVLERGHICLKFLQGGISIKKYEGRRGRVG
jgi:hypothetical protein